MKFRTYVAKIEDGEADMTDFPGYSAFESRRDLDKFGQNALLLFLAEMRLGIDDIETFAANSLTDGNNDKKTDLVAVLDEGSVVVVAQGYVSNSPKEQAPANKASDLNTAVSWLISGQLGLVPPALRGAAEEVRDALATGTVNRFEIWYSHNSYESKNVQDELEQVKQSADALIRRNYSDSSVDIQAIEFGKVALENEYARTKAPILVNGDFNFQVSGGFELVEKGWSSFSTVLPAANLRELWREHKTDLMSPNVRDYLGMAKKEGNINYGIKETAKNEPENFAIFNNGVTILVNDYSFDADDSEISVSGLGVVNGGQTTGALGELSDNDASGLDGARIMTRFVKCSNPETLENIIRFNNTQNKVEATDFRSKDPTQERLRKEFQNIPDADYKGGRRGGSTDAILRVRGLLPDSSVAQSVAAFHGRPNLAYNDLRSIWNNDAIYASVFRDSLSARHIVFTFGLLRAVEDVKQSLMGTAESDRTEAQARHAEFFRARGSHWILIAAIGGCIETILGRPIADKYDLKFKKNLSPQDSMKNWKPVVNTLVAFSKHLVPATDQGLKSMDKVHSAVDSFSSMVEATREINSSPFDSLSASVY